MPQDPGVSSAMISLHRLSRSAFSPFTAAYSWSRVNWLPHSGHLASRRPVRLYPQVGHAIASTPRRANRWRLSAAVSRQINAVEASHVAAQAMPPMTIPTSAMCLSRAASTAKTPVAGIAARSRLASVSVILVLVQRPRLARQAARQPRGTRHRQYRSPVELDCPDGEWYSQ